MSMKKLNVTFKGTTDKTGYLFSLAKCLSAALRCSKMGDMADDIIASSGFAFRMWIDSAQLCPSETSIWQFKKQKSWVENGGLRCEYIERLWGQDALEEERRLAALDMIRRSIDRGVAAVAWDISGCEWGAVIGYDDESQTFATRKINGKEDTLPYDRLGRLDLPILSVLTVIDKAEKTSEQLVADTQQLAVTHLQGKEWCDNAKGLAAYDALIDFIATKLSAETAWNLEYTLGTYGALKWYAWKFFEKYGKSDLAELYRTVYESWKAAFDLKRGQDVTLPSSREQLSTLLQTAKEAECRACEIMANV